MKLETNHWIRKAFVLLVITIFLVTNTFAQSPMDVSNSDLSLAAGDSISAVPSKKHIHQPRKATMFSAVLPGLGQIYNRKYWKLPIVYGGFGGIGYMVHWNQSRLDMVTKAYFDLSDKNPETRSYEAIFPYRDFSTPSTILDTQSVLRRYIESYRRQRDLVIIGVVGFYLLNVLDANVDAHLIDFDISEDLTVEFVPFSIDPLSNLPILGAQVLLRF